MYGTAGTSEGVDLVKSVGADAVFNHREDGYLQNIQVKYYRCHDIVRKIPDYPS